MESKIMTKGKLEVRYKYRMFEITPDWFVISDVDDGVKYMCETKDAYPRNILNFIQSDKDDNIIVENPDCWFGYLSFRDPWVNDYIECLVAAYINGWIEEYLEEHSMELKEFYTDIDAKYTK